MLFAIFFLLIILLYLLFWITCLLYAQAFGAPTAYANNKAVMDCLNLAELKKGEILIDLGCGNAKVLIIGARKFGAKGIGIERSPYCYLKSKINVLLSGQRKNIKVYFGDFKKVEEDIKKADVIYTYLLNSVKRKIESWLFSSISKNARVVSLAFTFPNHLPIDSAPTKTFGRSTKANLYMK